MNAREELAYDIAKAEYGWSREEWGGRDDLSPAKYYTLKYAGDLIAAGYSKQTKRLTDAELAAEVWAAEKNVLESITNGTYKAGGITKANILHRFATLLHYDEPQP